MIQHTGLKHIYNILQDKIIESLQEGLDHKALLAIDRMLAIAKFIAEQEKEKSEKVSEDIEFDE